ncbi:hypothetical protein SPRG_02895 [Saprolegnia parasitica CBS 223.65]|uniref:Intraflagellar transport protein 46 homolog n=1 Tax=Saprolegnia parasitica (strain CBS 223.65) TaxID=695850 RepID=A0A067CPI0_SAPPC|nr:hypothetical protein SPRG_02895 [Saprolegnia parasitica CBS 223.65]KDO32418.1 hypothetical protein SPRG_02895 [Saprolegnia parasitica CBS 223.65]|eukprot:XP_012196872.1 hypothetical protein SPRG_02895 [Saprolegnia parasitica CBS 223.65]
MPGKSDDEELSGSEEEEEVSGSESGSEEEDSDEDDDEQESKKDAKPKAKPKDASGGKERALQNQPFDAALDVSDSESINDPNSPKKGKDAKQLKNQPFDEALDLSGSHDIESSMPKDAPKKELADRRDDKASERPAPKERKEPPAKAASKAPAAANSDGGEVKNKPFDEQIDLSDSEASVDTSGAPSPEKPKLEKRVSMNQTLQTMPKSATDKVAAAEEKMAAKEAPKPSAAATKTPQSSSEGSGSDEEEDEDEEEEEEEEEEHAATSSDAAAAPSAASINVPGAYKESDFAHLKVTQDIKELFQYIGRFKAQEIELETRLKCFVPEYIPAIGEMDTFLKIPRPDKEADNLGLKVLDEPSIAQSDATVLDLQLRATSKKKHGDIVVRSIENAEKNVKEIDRWIKSIGDLHRTKPPPQVHYSKSMPDIETLMQVWPDEFEDLLSKMQLPNADLNVSLEQFTRIICAILDIPVYKNVYESLHVLFTLFLEFRSNQHFMNYENDVPLTNGLATTRLDMGMPAVLASDRK